MLCNKDDFRDLNVLMQLHNIMPVETLYSIITVVSYVLDLLYNIY